jgi:hypothetical protein
MVTWTDRFTATPPKTRAIRIVDTSTKIELALWHIRDIDLGREWDRLEGGLVFTHSHWTWVPVADPLEYTDTVAVADSWFKRLRQRDCLPL